jgi:hypothetical protein
MPEARSEGPLKEAERAGDVSLLRFASVLTSSDLVASRLPRPAGRESEGGERLHLVAPSRGPHRYRVTPGQRGMWDYPTGLWTRRLSRSWSLLLAGVTRWRSSGWCPGTGASCMRIATECSAQFKMPRTASRSPWLSAWRGLASFQGRSSVRAWALPDHHERLPAVDLAPSTPDPLAGLWAPMANTGDLGNPVAGPIWLESWPDDELRR